MYIIANGYSQWQHAVTVMMINVLIQSDKPTQTPIPTPIPTATDTPIGCSKGMHI